MYMFAKKVDYEDQSGFENEKNVAFVNKWKPFTN